VFKMSASLMPLWKSLEMTGVHYHSAIHPNDEQCLFQFISDTRFETDFISFLKTDMMS